MDCFSALMEESEIIIVRVFFYSAASLLASPAINVLFTRVRIGSISHNKDAFSTNLNHSSAAQ